MAFNYNISLSGLNAARYSLSITQNNIANINTEGYARQELSLSVQDTISGNGVESQIGNGVVAEKVKRIKDDLLIEQVRTQTTRVSYFNSVEEGLSNVESVLGELQEGSITNTMQDFFNSWEELSKYPSESSYREAVIGEANQLAFKFNAVSEDLRIYKTELDNKIKVDIDEANSLINQIASINKQIQNSESMVPNALLDKRDSYIDKLSEIGDVRIMPNAKDGNVMDVELGGMIVVSGVNAQEIKGIHIPQDDRWVIAVGNVPIRLTDGSLTANLELRNEYIPTTTQKLNELANTIITEVNSIHQSAYALDGSTGHDFFVGDNASTIAVSQAIAENPNLVSISDDATEKGNSDVARLLADIQFDNVMPSGQNPIEDWTGFVVSFGQNLNSASDNKEIYENVLNDLKSQKQSIQGVDLDEELAKLMQYEKFYQSNAKVMKTIDTVFSDLLNML